MIRGMSAEEYRRLEAGKMSETQLLEHIRSACRKLGLKCYHTHNSKHSERGFPDLVILGNPVLFRELKSSTGKVTPDQQAWLDELREKGQDAGVWRPADWVAGHVQKRLGEIAR